MKSALSIMALSSLLALGASPVIPACAQEPQSAVPDAPAPQAPKLNSNGSITPGGGTSAPAAPGAAAEAPAPTSSSSNDAAPSQTAPVAPPPAATPTVPDEPVETPDAGAGPEVVAKFSVNVNFVNVPVTVKDNKGSLVAGLQKEDFRIFEDGTYMPLRLFAVDPFPLSMAFVIDQSLTSDVMAKVNDSLDAVQGALAPYDEAAVFTYSNGSKEWTTFTGAQGKRLPAVLALAKAIGTDMQVPTNSGPFAGCNIRKNGDCVDPNLQPGHSAGSNSFMTLPKEIHTLNDAILSAAKELSSRPKERRRIIYVISDGKEYGSKATTKEVIRYLQTNNITVYATAVGDSARWGEGYLSRMHIPLTMYDNILFKYTAATGGDLDAERGVNGIEKSYAKIAEEARARYQLGYVSHRSIYDDRYRKIDVRVARPNVEVIAKQGYYPSSQDK